MERWGECICSWVDFTASRSVHSLFPPQYLASASPSPEAECPFLALWGKLLHRDGSLRLEAAARFRRCFENKNTPTAALGCFPLSVLRLEAPVEVFYSFYGD